MKKALVITGFHRSATSATANYLNVAGLHLGENLMQGSISNAKGHFEDWPAVRLHDQQLTNSGTSWQFHDEVTLQTSEQFLSGYIDNRSEHHSVWGVKDPRACLFLEEWERALSEQGHFLIIARHWSSCIESLLNRHSRGLAHSLREFKSNQAGFGFWSTPELAARMWLSYCQRLAAFAQKHPEKVIVCTQRALFEGAPVLALINTKFGFELDVDAVCPYESSLLNDSASQVIKDSLSQSLVSQLDNTWQALLAVACLRSSCEEPIYYLPSSIPIEFEGKYLDSVKSLFVNEGKNELGLERRVDKQDVAALPTDCTEQELINGLKLLRNNVTAEQIEQIERTVSQHFPLALHVWIEVGRVLQAHSMYERALNAYLQALALERCPPFVYMLIAQCHQGLHSDEQALYFFDRALQGNPNNPAFYVQKSKFYAQNNDHIAAENCLLDGIEKVGFNTPLVLAIAELLQTNDRKEEALALLNKGDQTHHSIQRLKSNIALALDYQNGVQSYHQMVKNTIEGKDKMRWLASMTKHISSSAAEQDFITRCYHHWQKLS
ncbi:hypothetical protein ACPV5R_19855 [Vibrio astriarenae]